MALSQSRDQHGGSPAAAADRETPTSRPNSPEHASFTPFPEGEGATNPDIPLEPILNKLYNKVLSLASSGKSPIPFVGAQQQQQPRSPTSADGKQPSTRTCG